DRSSGEGNGDRTSAVVRDRRGDAHRSRDRRERVRGGLTMRVTFLGTGTSTGVPVVGCRCRVCTSPDPRNTRLRQSVKIEMNGKHFLIDTTPDLRLQLLKHPIPRLDFVLYTHSHSDHLMGLDDIRPFNFRQREPIHAYASHATAKAIRRAFGYIWD